MKRVRTHSSSLLRTDIDTLDNSIRGFAYIEYESADDAEEAIFNMNDSELYNRVIKVDIAKPHRGLAGLDSTLPGISLPLHHDSKWLVWQQEEWIKTNVNKEGDGNAKESPDAMQGLELASQQQK
jgi:RNA recognition motif-containing protein